MINFTASPCPFCKGTHRHPGKPWTQEQAEASGLADPRSLDLKGYRLVTAGGGVVDPSAPLLFVGPVAAPCGGGEYIIPANATGFLWVKEECNE